MTTLKAKSSRLQIIYCTIMVTIALLAIYPFFYAMLYSFSDSKMVMYHTVSFYPIGFTFENYIQVFKSRVVFNSFLISIIRTLGGVVYSVSITGLAAYSITKKDMIGNRVISLFLIIPMYIYGGIIPTYVLIHDLHLFNNLLVYILPNGFWAFNMLLMRTYFETIPVSLDESARLDGAGDMTIFVQIIFPLSMPIIAVIALYNGVWQWNAWYDSVLYVTRPELKPLQSILQRLIHETLASSMHAQQGKATSSVVSTETLRMTTLLVTTLPIVFVYPFFQKYFVRGIMIGAVKA